MALDDHDMPRRAGSPWNKTQNSLDWKIDPQNLKTGSPARSAQPLQMTLPTDSQERKEYPLFRGVLRYFPAALAGVARISKIGNDKHNPGSELHHARGKSTDHADCILRHMMDLEDLRERAASPEEILSEASSIAWRALALSQELHEQFGAPLAPGAKK